MNLMPIVLAETIRSVWDMSQCHNPHKFQYVCTVPIRNVTPQQSFCVLDLTFRCVEFT